MKNKLVLALTLLILMTGTAYAGMAPLSPEFLKWREEQNNTVHTSMKTSETRNYGVRPSPLNLSHLASNPVKVAEVLPESFDLRDLNIVPPIRNQSLWGTCWTFATTAAIEINYLLQLKNGTMNAIPEIGSTPEEVDLSEMFLAWFPFMAPRLEQRITNVEAKDIRSPTGYSALSNGAYADVPVAIMARGYGWGPVLEKDMPYIGQFVSYDEVRKIVGPMLSGETQDEFNKRWEKVTEELTDPWCVEKLTGKKPSDYKSVLRIKEAAYVVAMGAGDTNDNGRMFRTENMNEIKQLIMDKGALYINYPAGGQLSGRRLSNDAYYFTSADAPHAVALIGWDDNYDVSNFFPDMYGKKPEQNGAWLIRNSWGENAQGHNGGYFWMSYEQPKLGTGTAFTMAAADSNLTIYTHSDLGWCGSLGDNKINSPFYGASVFKVGENNITLKEIGFYTTDNNASAEFTIYKYGTAKPIAANLTTGQAAAIIESKTFSYAGYHSVELDTNVTVNAGEYFAIVQKSTNPTFGYPLAVMSKIDNWSDFAQFHDNEGYISSNGTEWLDGVTITDKGKSTPATPCIYVAVTGAAAGDEGKDTENVRIDSLPVEDLANFAREINVDPSVNDTLNPGTAKTGRKFTLTLAGPDGNAVADDQDFVLYFMYVNDIFHWADDDSTSEWGIRYPSGDMMPLYPQGYTPDMFVTYSVSDDFGNTLTSELPVYGPFEARTSQGGKISFDVDNLIYADIGDIDKAGEKAKIPTGYNDLYYYEVEDIPNAAAGVVEDLELTEYDNSSGSNEHQDNNDATFTNNNSSSGCDSGLGSLMVICLTALAVFLRRAIS